MARARSIDQYIPRTAREREDQRDALAALSLMRREDLPASRAVDREGASLPILEKYCGQALKKRGNDFVAKPTDDLVRPPMWMLDAKGARPIEIRGSKAASLMSHYLHAVGDALAGQRAALKEFQGKTIPGTHLKFLTDLKTLHHLQDGGQLENIKEIYWHGRRR